MNCKGKSILVHIYFIRWGYLPEMLFEAEAGLGVCVRNEIERKQFFPLLPSFSVPSGTESHQLNKAGECFTPLRIIEPR